MQNCANATYICGSTDNLARKCLKRKTESIGSTRQPSQNSVIRTKVIKSKENPYDFFQSDSDDESSDIKIVRIQDKGSVPREVLVDVQGMLATGVIDSGADITIMGAELFKQLASVAQLKKKASAYPCYPQPSYMRRLPKM